MFTCSYLLSRPRVWSRKNHCISYSYCRNFGVTVSLRVPEITAHYMVYTLCRHNTSEMIHQSRRVPYVCCRSCKVAAINISIDRHAKTTRLSTILVETTIQIEIGVIACDRDEVDELLSIIQTQPPCARCLPWPKTA